MSFMQRAQAKAAVALIEIPGDEAKYFIIQRAHHPSDPWSGQLAFPGGKLEEDDESLFHTVIRETEEECGIQLDKHQLKESLPLFTAGRQVGEPILVAPYHFILDTYPNLTLDTTEIAQAFWVEESKLIDNRNHQIGPVHRAKPDYHAAHIKVEDEVLWGFTYKVLFHTLAWNNRLNSSHFSQSIQAFWQEKNQ